jgi:hypothetical protein
MPLILGRLRPVMLFPAIAALVAGAATLPAALDTAANGATAPAADSVAAKSVTGGRPFKPTSYWNTKLGQAPRNPHSAAWIRDSLNKSHTQNYLKLVMGDYSMPVYRSDASDPVYRFHSNGHTVGVHIPKHAHPMTGDDSALTIFDRATGQVVGLGGAKRTSGGWTAAGVSRYKYASNGIAGGLPGGSKANFGHRGIPASVAAVTKAEIRRGHIRHRLEVYWWETASRTPEGRSAYFPMTGSESGKTGVVPEGAVIRIKPGVNLDAIKLSPAARVIARALQQYGAVVGDNSGSGNNLKLQGNTNWKGILNPDSLRHIPWSDFVFVEGGYRP